MVAGLSVLSFRLIQLQLIDRHRYAESAHRAYDRVEVLPGSRGSILDRNEEVLAKSLPVSSVVVDRNHLEDPKLAALGLAYERASQEPGWETLDDTEKKRKIMILRGKILDSEDENQIIRKHLAYAIGILARPLGMRREELRDKIENTKGAWIPIVKELPDDVAEGLRDAISHNWIQGFTFENSLKRWYTAPNLATHVVGFTGEKEESGDNGKPVQHCVGVFGVEAALETYLAGRDGWREHRRDARGLLIPGDATSLKPPRSGLNVQLTLDMGTQTIIEEELDAALAEYESARGAVVVMDPKQARFWRWQAARISI